MELQGVNYAPKTYVRGASVSCREQGCQSLELAAMLGTTLGRTRELIESLEGTEVKMQPTQALWCEQGGHSFSEKDPDVQVISIAGRGPDGQTVEESRTSCGECATLAKTRLGKTRNAPVSELPPSDS
jgi:hypothetical protein